MAIQPGKYRARCTGEQDVQFGYTSGGAEQIAVLFRIEDEGPAQGDVIAWYGNFSSDDATKLALKALRNCGWEGDNITNLAGIDANEVDLVIAHEEWNGELKTKVKYVNKAGEVPIVMKDQMDAGAKAAFANKLRGKIVALGQKSGAPSASKPAARPANGGGATRPPAKAWDGTGPNPDDDIPFLSSEFDALKF